MSNDNGHAGVLVQNAKCENNTEIIKKIRKNNKRNYQQNPSA